MHLPTITTYESRGWNAAHVPRLLIPAGSRTTPLHPRRHPASFGTPQRQHLSTRVQTRTSNRHTCGNAYTYLNEHSILSLEGAWAQATGRSARLRHKRTNITTTYVLIKLTRKGN